MCAIGASRRPIECSIMCRVPAAVAVPATAQHFDSISIAFAVGAAIFRTIGGYATARGIRAFLRLGHGAPSPIRPALVGPQRTCQIICRIQMCWRRELPPFGPPQLRFRRSAAMRTVSSSSRLTRRRGTGHRMNRSVSHQILYEFQQPQTFVPAASPISASLTSPSHVAWPQWQTTSVLSSAPSQ